MKERVLFVDDEPNVLDGIRRQLRNRVELETATSAAAALELIRSRGPYAVVVSDMRMPQMDGARFLTVVNQIQPETVRMVLTGQADLESTIQAVNEGRIFRFLLKPCDPDTLLGVVKAGIDQYRLITAEKHLLENTLNATVKVLCDVLGIINPIAQRRAQKVQRYADCAAEALKLPGLWQYRLAALMCKIGCITLPSELLARVFSGGTVSEEERRLYESHPAVAGKLIGNIPRLESVAAMVAMQMQVPARDLIAGDPTTWAPEKIGAAILWAALRFDHYVSRGCIPDQAAQLVHQAAPGLPLAISEAMVAAVTSDSGLVMSRTVSLGDLAVGMTIDADVLSERGTRLVPSGTRVDTTIIERLRAVAGGVGVVEPIRISEILLD